MTPAYKVSPLVGYIFFGQYRKSYSLILGARSNVNLRHLAPSQIVKLVQRKGEKAFSLIV